MHIRIERLNKTIQIRVSGQSKSLETYRPNQRHLRRFISIDKYPTWRVAARYGLGFYTQKWMFEQRDDSGKIFRR